MNEQEIAVSNLDHLGIVAGMIDELGIVETIDTYLVSQRKVSPGTMVKALILNGMGFSQHALYITPAFFERCSVDHLLGPAYTASDFNDDSIGRTLDDLFAFGISPLFAQVAHKACTQAGISDQFVHVDTTNFSLEGAYEADQQEGAVKICHGYAKNKRFDLKQVTLGLITTYQTAIPRYMQTFDGNVSDKQSLVSMIQNYVSCFKGGEWSQIFVADSGLYSAANISNALAASQWITRVPETLKEAQMCLEQTTSTDLQVSTQSVGYSYRVVASSYGGVSQRWLVVHSDPLASAVGKTYTKKAEQQIATVLAALTKKSSYLFKEPADLVNYIADLACKYPLVHHEYGVKQVTYYCKQGKPKAENQRLGHQLDTYTVTLNTCCFQSLVASKSRFILATNVLDTTQLSHEALLTAYKSQATSVERGFKFLKDPIFFAESFFVHTPSRLESLLMIMGLSLLVYSLCERNLQTALASKGDTLLTQANRPTHKPTTRMIFNLFRGIHLVCVKADHRLFCTNLTETHKKIVSLLGNNIAKYYFLSG